MKQGIIAFSIQLGPSDKLTPQDFTVQNSADEKVSRRGEKLSTANSGKWMPSKRGQ